VSAFQKVAWFNLAVVAATLVVVVALIPVLGTTRAHGGFGLLGLLGFAPLFLLRGGQVLGDERDLMIVGRAGLIAFWIFWLAFVAACMSLPAVYGWDGLVPVSVVLSGVWCGVMVVVGVGAVATLVMYQLGRADAT
jgi:hypothetical protein